MWKGAVNDESNEIDGVNAAFHDAVDRYLAFCANVVRHPCKGSLMCAECCH